MSQKTNNKNHEYETRREALIASKKIKGCEGETHSHGSGDKKIYMPCKSHKKYKDMTKSKKEDGEVNELIDFDGTLMNSKIPKLNPATTEKGSVTMDKVVAATRITQDPLMRGYRVYYGESVVREEDMEDAFGFDETKFLDGEETMKYFEEELGMSEEDAAERTKEQGKDPDGELDEKSRHKNKKGFVAKLRLKEKKEFTKEDIIKMSEDLLTKKSEDKEITEKEKNNEIVSPIIKRNIEALKNMASAEGISLSQLLKLMKK